ncbi:unknown [Prevotella sp. CAG:1092]|nr:unknown [Prevotella sp. CAG:1092]
MRKFMFAAVSAMVIVCVSNVFANQSAMQFESNDVIQSDSVVTDSANQGAVEVAAPVDTTASSENAAIENASSENAATENAETEVPAKSESNATAENAEATVDSAVAR